MRGTRQQTIVGLTYLMSFFANGARPKARNEARSWAHDSSLYRDKSTRLQQPRDYWR